MSIINSRSEIQRNVMNLTFEEGSIRSINDELKLNSINAVLKIDNGLETARTLFQALTEDKITNVHNIVYNLCAYVYNLDYAFELSLLLGSEYKFSIVRTNKHFKLSVSRIEGESYKKVASYKIKHTIIVMTTEMAIQNQLHIQRNLKRTFHLHLWETHRSDLPMN